MARPLRIEFAGALYHLTARGNAREKIFIDDVDREMWLTRLQQTCQRHQWLCHAYCLMSNHYHLLIETPGASLSKGMKLLNGGYTLTQVGEHFGVSYATVSRALKRFDV